MTYESLDAAQTALILVDLQVRIVGRQLAPSDPAPNATLEASHAAGLPEINVAPGRPIRFSVIRLPAESR